MMGEGMDRGKHINKAMMPILQMYFFLSILKLFLDLGYTQKNALYFCFQSQPDKHQSPTGR